MPRRLQASSAGIVFHVLNRAARRARIFCDDDDYLLFERLMNAALDHVPMRILSYVIMPNHWHLVLWPTGDADLSNYMQWLTRTHAQAWHVAHASIGTGALYQGRFKAIPVQSDGHFLTVCRYVERNPVRARIVARPSEWRWGSAWTGRTDQSSPCLTPWPVERPADWSERVEMSDEDAAEKLRAVIVRGVPYGDQEWTIATAARLALPAPAGRRGHPGQNAPIDRDVPIVPIDRGGITPAPVE